MTSSSVYPYSFVKAGLVQFILKFVFVVIVEDTTCLET